jgi:hypothetical protein
MAKAVREGTSSTAASIAPRGRLNEPVISRYACGASIGKAAPASTSGLPKSAIDSMNTTRNALATPGSDRGSTTRLKTCQRDAPTFMAASSRVGLMPASTPRRLR